MSPELERLNSAIAKHIFGSLGFKCVEQDLPQAGALR